MSAGPPPPGIDLDEDVKNTVIGPVLALMVLSGISVALRTVSKLSSHSGLELDDYFLYAALIFAWATGIASVLACVKGIGKHVWNPTVDLEGILKILWAYEYLYGSVIPLTKLSLVFFYHRLFHVAPFRKLLWINLFLVLGWWIAILLVVIFQCQPYSYFWKQYVDPTAHGKCIDIGAFFIGNGAASVVTDFLILLTPIPMVWNLQMPRMQRLSVLGIFFLGGFVCVAGVLRVHALISKFGTVDVTWTMVDAFIWSSVEPNVGIICACLPTFRPLLRRLVPRWFNASVQESTGPKHGSQYTTARRSGVADFYSLEERQISGQDKSDDELVLTGKTCPRQQAAAISGAANGAGPEPDHGGIMVKREFNCSTTAG